MNPKIELMDKAEIHCAVPQVPVAQTAVSEVELWQTSGLSLLSAVVAGEEKR
ncbi:hypothetical protein [Bradyrhizobium sp. LTSPM299]|uniref:hypothetical protein n=1 Tax=Bradyrhizobium sp. LTSPM299 TaxID=1619233 RepID=UPI0012E25E97|nr:hypothetical protein [Bradyrhizobium sp. LTSPM299]